MTEPGFDREALARLRAEPEVRIATRAADGTVHRTIIWVVVDDADRVLIRSYRGAKARWYVEAVAAGTAELLVDGLTLRVRIEAATDAERVEACSRALEAKYPNDPATPAMLRPEILATTLELFAA